MKTLNRLLSTIFLVTFSAHVYASQSESIRVLFIGNSYTYADDIPWITKQLATSAKESKTLEVEMIAPPGATLQGHWGTGDVVNRLRETNWNYAVLQEQSSRPIETPALTKLFSKLFDGEIKKAGAKTVLFVTWPRREHPEQLTALTNTYLGVAKELGATIAPVGIAWSEVLKVRPTLQIYHADGSHPNPVGSYIAACVFYSVFYGKSPAGLSRTLYTVKRDGSHVKVGELSEGDAKFIQSIAWQSVQKFVQLKSDK